jgi:haloalkane dehalogenase
MFPTEMLRDVVDVGDDLHMHVAQWGDPRAPAVVMVHGNPSWGLLYRKVVAELRARKSALRLVVPDLVGLGLSSKPRDPDAHTVEAHGAWLGRMLDRMALDRVILVVQDWGGPIGLHAMADRAERLAGVVILNTVVGPPRPGFRATAFHRFARMPVISELAFRWIGFPQNAMTLAQGRRTSLLGRAQLGYMWPLRSRRDRTAPLALARMVPDNHDHPSIPALARCHDTITAFRGPISIVWGDRDPVLGRAIGHLERLLPHAEVTRTEAGHFLQEEVPEAIADAVVSVAARADAN